MHPATKHYRGLTAVFCKMVLGNFRRWIDHANKCMAKGIVNDEIVFNSYASRIQADFVHSERTSLWKHEDPRDLHMFHLPSIYHLLASNFWIDPTLRLIHPYTYGIAVRCRVNSNPNEPRMLEYFEYLECETKSG